MLQGLAFGGNGRRRYGPAGETLRRSRGRGGPDATESMSRGSNRASIARTISSPKPFGLCQCRAARMHPIDAMTELRRPGEGRSQGRATMNLTGDQKKTVAAAFLGWMLDAFDFFLLTFLLKDIAKEFGVEISAVAYALFLTLAMRFVGAFIFGRLGDRPWRRRTAPARSGTQQRPARL